MTCKYCGGVIAEDTRFCPHCGVACAELTASLPTPPPPAPRVRKKKQRPKKPRVDIRGILRGMKCMKWHKFTVNFLLFVMAALLLAGGAAYLTGYAHTSDAELLYKYYPQMYPLDLAAAGVSLLLATWVLVARFRLARLRKNGRGWLFSFYIAAILFPVGYQVAGYFLCRAAMISLGYIIYVAVYLVLFLIHVIYYTRKKRRGVFVY